MDQSIFAKFMENFAANVSVIVSLVSVVSTAGVTLWASHLSSKNERKMKKMELSYEQRLNAYLTYLTTSAETYDALDQAQITALDNAAGQAMLFASRRTFALIEAHKNSVSQTLLANAAKSDKVMDYARRSSEIKNKLVRSMQHDLGDD